MAWRKGEDSLIVRMKRDLIGQDKALDTIIPYVEIYEANLSPDGRPAGIFLLVGPTGCGKTRTVEVLAEALHGSRNSVVRINCGEYTHGHEVAKLAGSPPGFLGHRETKPLLTQQALGNARSAASDLALVLFDEIEKAHHELFSLILGILDKGMLSLGDNTVVNFEKTMVFMTSNLGARQMMDSLNERFGFKTGVMDKKKVGGMGRQAAVKKLPPEFINRIDAIVQYEPLTEEAMRNILNLEIDEIQALVDRRLGDKACLICLTDEARAWLLEKGYSKEYGARELKRVLRENVLLPLARSFVGSGSGRFARFVVVDGALKLTMVNGGSA